MRQGKDLILSDSQTGSGHFACATSCTVSVKSDYIEVAHPTDGGWKRYKPTILSWSASTGHLLASYSNYKYFRAMMDNKQAVTVRFYDVELQIFYKGQAYIETLELTGDVRGFAKMKVSLQPSGPLTAAEETVINANEYYGIQTKMDFNSDGSVTLREKTQDESGIYGTEITTTAIKTRITLNGKGAVVEMDKTSLKTVITARTSVFVNRYAVLINPTEGTKTVIVGPGTYQVIINQDDHAGSSYVGTYMSSF